MRALALALPLLAVACSGTEGEDWMVAEARAPDGRHVARLWCENQCDVAGKLTLTISPASRRVSITPSTVQGFPGEGQMPAEDVRGSFYVAHVETRAEPDGAETLLRWSDAATLEVQAPCPDAREETVVPERDGTRFTLRPRADVPCPGGAAQ